MHGGHGSCVSLTCRMTWHILRILWYRCHPSYYANRTGEGILKVLPDKGGLMDQGTTYFPKYSDDLSFVFYILMLSEQGYCSIRHRPSLENSLSYI